MHRITLNTHQGYDPDNKLIGPPVTSTLPGWLVKKQSLVLNKNDEEVTAQAHMRIGYNTSITLEDTVNYDNRTWEIIAIQQDRDFTNKVTILYFK